MTYDMHKFQQCHLSHWWSRLEGGSVLLADQETSALLKLHNLEFQNEVCFGKSPHPLLPHVTQPFVPQLIGIVSCNIHFFPACSGMHKLQCVDLLGSGHDHARMVTWARLCV